ncbi:hypothetical protein LK12_23220 [Novosphingobium malaysiense]|uniref:Uncharacterized protein n=1 Tax=Novosphingobium malaysiense TaxID=1348853 RepID=A0A0B1ZI72_9SPHN|nr:hypothetical protein LK12_23220 [Novosphingobium malaysiense]
MIASQRIILVCSRGVLREADAFYILIGESAAGSAFAHIAGLGKELGREIDVLVDAFAVQIAGAEIRTGGGISFIASASKKDGGTLEVFRHSTAIEEDYAKGVARLLIASIASF